jgi:predicted ribosome quality control (RQC) complex YloA/Tae2 family protein
MKVENVFIKELKREVTYYIGKNQNENFLVIDKGNNDDLWFHAADESSCHVVCEVPDDIMKKELQYIITIGAMLCKNNTSKLKSAKNVHIIYTKIQNIIKTDVPGCVLTNNTKQIIC